MSTTPANHDRTGRRYHHVYADYFVGRADELVAGDGFRLIPAGRPIPVELVVPLVVTAVCALANGTLAVEFIDRAAMVSGVVDEALFDLPAAADPTVVGLRIFDAHEAVLIRG